MRVKVTAKSPTHHKMNAVAQFGPVEFHQDGSVTFEEIFDTKVDAQRYLFERLSVINDRGEVVPEDEAIKSITSGGYLEYDGVTAYIEPYYKSRNRTQIKKKKDEVQD